jgi:UDP-2,4-diacetamido-2,4,6-trideoxy-beta-L-altropyranose hydrolase
MLVRADASAAIGMGHAMRCLALAQALADVGGGTARFLMADPPPPFVERAARDEVGVAALAAPAGGGADAEAALTLATEIGAAWVVVDGYHFDDAYQRALIAGGARVLAFDDHAQAGAYHADLVLNQNLGASPSAYTRRDPRTRLLLGVRYALLRREFRAWDEASRAQPEVARRVLVTMGGSDPDDVSSRVVDALAGVTDPLDVCVLVGAANPHAEALQRAAAACPHQVALVRDAQDVPQRMAWADLALASASGTSWELARVGTPQIAIVLADNQRPAGEALGREELAVSLGWHADLTAADLAQAVGGLLRDAARRADMARRGRALIDGRGALRVLAAMGLARASVAA